MGRLAAQTRLLAALLAPLAVASAHPSQLQAQAHPAGTLTDFGYYIAQEANGSLPAAAASHSTTTFLATANASGAAAATALSALEAINISGVVACSGVFLNSSATGLAPGWEARWAAYWQAVQPYSRSILAFYPVDEPSPGLIACKCASNPGSSVACDSWAFSLR